MYDYPSICSILTNMLQSIRPDRTEVRGDTWDVLNQVKDSLLDIESPSDASCFALSSHLYSYLSREHRRSSRTQLPLELSTSLSRLTPARCPRVCP